MIAALGLSLRGAAYMGGWVTGKLLATAIRASVRYRP